MQNIILDKILANLTQQCIKNIIHLAQLSFLELFKIELHFHNGTLAAMLRRDWQGRRGRRRENNKEQDGQIKFLLAVLDNFS